MTDRTVELAIRATADASEVLDSFADIQAAARKLDASDVEDFVRDANRSLDGFKDGLDSTASTASQAAGGLGDLAGGLELAGFDGAAAKLEQAAVAIQTVAGVADLATVATNLLSASKIKDTAATVANKAATIASTAATKAAAAGQWLLNAALTANPIGLIILAVVALVAGFVLLYKKSETFRSIVQKVGDVGRKAIGWIVDRVGDLVGWVRDKAPAAFNKFKQIATTAIKYVPIVFLIRKAIELVGWVRDKAPAAWDRMRSVAVRAFNAIPIVWLIRKAIELVGWVKDELPDAWDRAKRVAVRAFEAITAPIEAVIDFVDDLVDAISDIDWPDPPDWLKDLGGGLGDLLGKTAAVFPSGGSLAPTSPFPVETTRGGAPAVVEHHTWNVEAGWNTPDDVAAAIETMLERRRRRLGIG